MQSNPGFREGILLVDDESHFLGSASLALRMAGFSQILTASTGEQGLAALGTPEGAAIGLVFLDVSMPGMSGPSVLETLNSRYPELIVCMMTAHNDVRLAVDCMRGGAFDYLVKPLDGDQLIACARRALDRQQLLNEARALKNMVWDNSLRQPEAFTALASNSPAMHQVFRYIEAIAPARFAVLVTGESGAGKELAARAIHECSGRKGAFISVNAAGIEDALLSDALFGHLRGAFTGADRERKGLIEEAADGTLFLDEIGDLRPESQVKLLRLLQEGTYLPMGADTHRRSSARIVAATHRDLIGLCRQGIFRFDLYYRLEPHEVRLPPLRERMQDIPLLARLFVDEIASELERPAPRLPDELIPLLCTYHWPGNVRELKGMLEDAVSRNTTPVLSLESLRIKLRERRSEPELRLVAGDVEAKPHGQAERQEDANVCRVSFNGPLPDAAQLELHLIHEALRRTNNNKTLAADLIGMARQTLLRKLKAVGTE